MKDIEITEERKGCHGCDGSGRINKRKEKAAIDYNRSKEDQADDYFIASDVCPTCNGKGYVVKQTRWE